MNSSEAAIIRDDVRVQTQTMRFSSTFACSTTLACALLLAWPQSGRAEAQGAGDSGAAQDPIVIAAAVDGGSVANPSGAVLLGGKMRGITSGGGLDPFVHGGFELGYVFPTLRHGFAAVLQVEYSMPIAEAGMHELFARERGPGFGYHSQLLQKELVLQPTFLYRMTSLFDSITPFVGLGLRLYFAESIITASMDDEDEEEARERSTTLGGGLPIGAEFALGPGALTGEVLLEWGPLKHLITGATHNGGVSVCAGYRMLR